MRSVAELVRAADRLTALETVREAAVDRAA